MRKAVNVVGVLCLLVGIVWFLQGINVIPGSFMTGQKIWANIGGVVFTVGLGLLLGVNFGRKR